MTSFKPYFLTRPSSEIDNSYLSRLFILVKLTGASKGCSGWRIPSQSKPHFLSQQVSAIWQPYLTFIWQAIPVNYQCNKHHIIVIIIQSHFSYQ